MFLSLGPELQLCAANGDLWANTLQLFMENELQLWERIKALNSQTAKKQNTKLKEANTILRAAESGDVLTLSFKAFSVMFKDAWLCFCFLKLCWNIKRFHFAASWDPDRRQTPAGAASQKLSSRRRSINTTPEQVICSQPREHVPLTFP